VVSEIHHPWLKARDTFNLFLRWWGFITETFFLIPAFPASLKGPGGPWIPGAPRIWKPEKSVSRSNGTVPTLA